MNTDRESDKNPNIDEEQSGLQEQREHSKMSVKTKLFISGGPARTGAFTTDVRHMLLIYSNTSTSLKVTE